MYQPPKCPYSYLLKVLEFYFRVFFSVSILKIDLNVVEISNVHAPKISMNERTHVQC